MDFSTKKKMISDQSSWGSPEKTPKTHLKTLAHKKAWVIHPGRSGQVPPSCKDPNRDSG
jgi:hypothetical protein